MVLVVTDSAEVERVRRLWCGMVYEEREHGVEGAARLSTYIFDVGCRIRQGLGDEGGGLGDEGS